MTLNPKVTTTLKISTINRDTSTQARANMNEATIADYVEAITGDGDASPADLPPIVVFLSEDSEHLWLGDGWHRLAAYEKAGRTHVSAMVERGERRDAVLYAIGANADHGLRRTDEDKRRAVEMLLDDKEWSQLASPALAGMARVTARFVNKVRKDRGQPYRNNSHSSSKCAESLNRESVEPEPAPKVERRKCANGTIRRVRIKPPAAPKVEPEPTPEPEHVVEVAPTLNVTASPKAEPRPDASTVTQDLKPTTAFPLLAEMQEHRQKEARDAAKIIARAVQALVNALSRTRVHGNGVVHHDVDHHLMALVMEVLDKDDICIHGFSLVTLADMVENLAPTIRAHFREGPEGRRRRGLQ